MFCCHTESEAGRVSHGMVPRAAPLTAVAAAAVLAPRAEGQGFCRGRRCLG